MTRWVLILTILLALAVPAAAQLPTGPGSRLQDAAAANGDGDTLALNGSWPITTLQVSGSFTATVNFEGSVDASNWTALFCKPVNGGVAVTTATAAGTWRCNTTGLVRVRARVSGHGSGSVTVDAASSEGTLVYSVPPGHPEPSTTFFASAFQDCDQVINEIGNATGTLFLDKSCAMATAATAPNTLAWVVLRDGSLQPASGITAIIQGPLLSFHSDPFQGDGTVTLSGSNAVLLDRLRIESNELLTNSGGALLSLPTATDTVVGRATTDTLTNKTMAAGSNSFSGFRHGTEVDQPSSGVHGVTGDVVGTTDTQTLSNKTLDSSNTLAGTSFSTLTITDAAPATPTANEVYADSIVKGWVRFDGTGTVAIDDDLNVSSITDNAVGDYTINWATALASANYAVAGAAGGITGIGNVTLRGITAPLTATSARIVVTNASGGSADREVVTLIAIGEQ